MVPMFGVNWRTLMGKQPGNCNANQLQSLLLSRGDPDRKSFVRGSLGGDSKVDEVQQISNEVRSIAVASGCASNGESPIGITVVFGSVGIVHDVSFCKMNGKHVYKQAIMLSHITLTVKLFTK